MRGYPKSRRRDEMQECTRRWGWGVTGKNWHRNGLYCRLTAGRGSERLFETEHIILRESIATVPHAQTKE